MYFVRHNKRSQQWGFHSRRSVDSNASRPHNTLHRSLAHNNAFRSRSNPLVGVSLDTGKGLRPPEHRFSFESQRSCLPRNFIGQGVGPANMTLFFKEYAPRIRASQKSCCFCICPRPARIWNMSRRFIYAFPVCGFRLGARMRGIYHLSERMVY